MQILDGRLERIDAEIAAERAAGGDTAKLEAERVRTALERAESVASAEERIAEAREQASKRMQDIDERRAQLAGATDADVLQGRIDRMSAELAAEETTQARKIELEVELAEARIELEEDAAKAAEDAAKRRLQLVQQLTRAAVASIGDELTRRKRFSDEDVEIEEDRLAERRREIEMDYKSRDLTEREYHAKVRELKADTQAFRQAVADDQRNVLAALASSTTAIVRQAAEEAIAAKLAQFAADYFTAANAFFSFLGPFSAVAAVATVPAALAAFNSIIPAFATGGLVAGGPQIIQVNERGTEFVLNADATRGNEGDLYRLQTLLAGGRKLRDLFPGMETGGIPGLLSPPPVYNVSAAAGYDDSARRAQADRHHFEQRQDLDRLADRMQPPPVAIGGARARLIGRAQQRAQHTSEITRPSLVVSTRRDR